jgi:hypothetical protein
VRLAPSASKARECPTANQAVLAVLVVLMCAYPVFPACMAPMTSAIQSRPIRTGLFHPC